MKRRVLVISRNEEVGEWFRGVLGGRKSGQTVTVVGDLQPAIRMLKRTSPHVVIFVEEGPERDDDRLMLLRALLLIEEQCHRNTLAILYDLAENRMTMYHNVHFPQVNRLDVAMAAQEGARCPLFGDAEEADVAAQAYPADCPYLPIGTAGMGAGCGTAVRENESVERKE